MAKNSSKVIIVGCGVAGPAIALLLKKKGYEPVVLEKVRELGDAGASLMMFPNGLKVLSLVGLADFASSSAPHLAQFCDRSADGTEIGTSDIPLTFQEQYGQPGVGVKRTALNLALKNALIKENINVIEGWKLDQVIEQEDHVVAISSTGDEIQGSFLIGCDGIKAVSRTLTLAKHNMPQEKASYTGLTQTAGITRTPPSLKDRARLMNIYGPSAHIICYPVSPTMTSWAITQRDLSEAQETWRIFSVDEMAQHRNELLTKFKDWCSPVPELIQDCERIIKYGLYDRPQLEPEQWFSPQGRCVLIGDAAHPTSPHLGQGANQALEDCYHLQRLLPDISENNNDGVLSTPALSGIFSSFAQLRQPRTAALVKGARLQGESRVEDGGPEACLARDERIREAWTNKEAVEARYRALFVEPF